MIILTTEKHQKNGLQAGKRDPGGFDQGRQNENEFVLLVNFSNGQVKRLRCDG